MKFYMVVGIDIKNFRFHCLAQLDRKYSLAKIMESR